MTLVSGSRLGPYEIVASIGAGGMGEVFRAHDTKLNRDVAIKVLPAAFADDPERLARFTREAQTLASLNHPNIAGIYGIEELPAVSGPLGPGSRALVMELVEGEDLSVHIARGPIPIAEALPIARQIAEALEAAHEQGIVHRDLKPANIKVRTDGTVKVLDFGLAKAMDQGGSSSSNLNVSHSPTLTHQGTTAGMIIGTAAYMSPEQAKGKTVDRRADIWSFGVVVYEMLTGTRCFKGEDVSDTLAAVLRQDVNLKALPADTPARLTRLIARCLDRDLKTRLRDIGEARVKLARIEAGGPDSEASAPPATAAGSSSRSRLPWALVAVLTIALVSGLLAWAPWRSVPVPFETRLDINTPPTDDPTSFAISPDGRRLVFVATAANGQSLWLRSLDQTAAQVLQGTEGASYPFWSPDSRSVAFFASGKLKRLDIGAGLPQTLVDRVDGRGGSWSTAGMILFGQNTGPLAKIPAAGGAASDVTKLTPEQNGHRWPRFLPDGRQFLFFVQGKAGLHLGSLDSLDSKKIADADTGAQFVAPDRLLFLRQGTLFAQRLDLTRGELTGEPVSIADQVMLDVTRSNGAFSVSPEGWIAYRTGGSIASQFTWFDRSGKVKGTIGSPDQNGLLQPTLSPDGRRVVAYRTAQGNIDLWLFETGRETRFTFDGGRYPVWSPDGTRIVFTPGPKGAWSLKQASSTGGGAEELLLPPSGAVTQAPAAFSPDGRFLMYAHRDPGTAGDLWVLPLDGKQKPSVFLNSKFQERMAQFSPDGRWVAYASDESDRYEIYLRPFPAGSGQFQVSTLGGMAPRWRRDGKELYYIAPDTSLMAVSMATTGRAPEMGAPVALFQPRILHGGALPTGFLAQYDVAPDGRFLINVMVGDAVTAPITVIQNWAPKK